MSRQARVRASSVHTRGHETHAGGSSGWCNADRTQESWLEVRRGHIGIERIGRTVQMPVAETNDVLIDAARRQREHPSFGRSEEIRDEVADLHDREVMTRRIETKREKIVNVVVGLAARREDRPNPARCDDRHVAADWIVAYDTSDRSAKRDAPMGRTERAADPEPPAATRARCDAARHPGRIHDARPDRSRASRCEVRIGEKTFEHERDVSRAAGRWVVA